MGNISLEFTALIAEAIGLPPNAFDRFFDNAQQHKLKIVKYPDLEELGAEGEAQGVGPHKDSMLTSYLLQASHHKGLQVQAPDGKWIDCPPINGTMVVAIGQGMQALTQGVCQSTTHRVLSPARGSGPRYSIPFFQGVSYDATFESMDVPESVKELRSKILERRGERVDDIEFTFMSGRYHHLGEATLMNRIKSHPDVGEKFVRTPSPFSLCRCSSSSSSNNGFVPARLTDVRQYPDLLKKIRAQQQQEQQEQDARKSHYAIQPSQPRLPDKETNSHLSTIQAH